MSGGPSSPNSFGPSKGADDMAKLDRELIAMYAEQTARDLYKALPRPTPDANGPEFTCGTISALLRFAAALFVPGRLDTDEDDALIDDVYLAARKAMGRAVLKRANAAASVKRSRRARTTEAVDRTTGSVDHRS